MLICDMRIYNTKHLDVLWRIQNAVKIAFCSWFHLLFLTLTLGDIVFVIKYFSITVIEFKKMCFKILIKLVFPKYSQNLSLCKILFDDLLCFINNKSLKPLPYYNDTVIQHINSLARRAVLYWMTIHNNIVASKCICVCENN